MNTEMFLFLLSQHVKRITSIDTQKVCLLIATADNEIVKTIISEPYHLIEHVLNLHGNAACIPVNQWITEL